jgi:ABC-type nickel/cobalt efflux system permease component RcnA
MLILGLLLILGSAALTAGVIYDGSEAASVEMFGTTVDTTVAGVFFTGAATTLLLFLGIWLCFSSMGRSRRKRTERKEARRQQRDSVAKLEKERVALAAENERLNAQLGSDRPTTDTTDDNPTAVDTSTTGTHTRTEADQR